MSKNLLFVGLLALAAPVFAKTDALSLVPNDAVSVGVIRFADLRTSPLSGTLFQQTDKVSTNGEAADFLRETGLQPSKDIDVLVVATAPKTALGTDAKVLVAADGRFNIDRLTKALLDRGAVKKSTPNGTYFLLPDSKNERTDEKGAVAFPDAHLAIAGTESAVATALADRAAGGTSFATASGLGREIVRIDAHASAWALVDVARASRLVGGAHVPANGKPANAALSAALKNVSTVAIWATDTGDSLKLNAFGLAHDAETLQLVEDTLRGALSAIRLAAADKNPEVVTMLRRFNVTRTDDSVSISGTIPADTVKQFVAKQK